MITIAVEKVHTVQVFVVAIKRSGKSASWAVQYARLCSHLKAAAQPLSLDDTVQEALYGRCCHCNKNQPLHVLLSAPSLHKHCTHAVLSTTMVILVACLSLSVFQSYLHSEQVHRGVLQDDLPHHHSGPFWAPEGPRAGLIRSAFLSTCTSHAHG